MAMSSYFDPQELPVGQIGTLELVLEAKTGGKFVLVVRDSDTDLDEPVFEGGTTSTLEVDLEVGKRWTAPVLFARSGEYVLRFKRDEAKYFQYGDTVTVQAGPVAAPKLPFTFALTPSAMHQNEFGTLTFRLATGSPAQTIDLLAQAPGTASPNVFDGNTASTLTGLELAADADREIDVVFPATGDYVLRFRPAGAGDFADFVTIPVQKSATSEPDATVALAAQPRPVTPDEVLWRFIDRITDRLRFDEFCEFVMRENKGSAENAASRPFLMPPDPDTWRGTIAYDTLRELAELFVNQAADPARSADSEIPKPIVEQAIRQSYVSTEGADLASPFLGKPSQIEEFSFPLPNIPFVELIWNYWIEEGMLVQSLYHILAKFQNRRPGQGRDPLERFDLNPLLPLRQLLWGFAEDERRRLTVRRRAAEYEYEYGLQLRGRAVPPQSSVVERRSAFLEAFHSLLYETHRFYKERDDKTVDADAFPLLSGLRELHLVLAYGAHNQFANLALQARSEMLTMQWLLAQPEMREFLGGRTMVPYEEPWMDRVDAMKSIQGWADTSITHFFDLAVHGERILLSVRHGRWNESGRNRDDASSWALRSRNSIQRYLHAYRAVSGVDLSSSVNGNRPPDLATMPSDLLLRRVGAQQRRRA